MPTIDDVERSARVRGYTSAMTKPAVLVVDDEPDLCELLSITLTRMDLTPRTAQNLASALRAAAAGEGTLPPDLLGRLLSQVGHLQRQVLAPRGLTFGGLTEREIAVLRLLADGLDTAEVGAKLYYSERTVKNIIHDVTSRLDLRNRTHAVAYAIREGLI